MQSFEPSRQWRAPQGESLPPSDGSIPPFGLSHPSGRPLHVLIVDDDPLNRQLTLRMLQKEGHSAEAVESGFEAIERAQPGAYHVVLMDIEMPAVDGLTATREIRRRTASAPDGLRPFIVGVTAHDLPDDRDHCLRAGMDDYMPKPISRATLRQVLARAPRGFEAPTAK